MDIRYQVFVSSTYADLKEERLHVLKSLMEMDCIPSGMELFPAVDEEQWEYIQKVIDECDYYLLILGGRYGSVAEDGISYTEKEFDYAVKKGKKIVALLHKSPDELPVSKTDKDKALSEKLEKFRAKVTQDRLVKFWSKTEELPGLVVVSMTKLIKAFPSNGWVRANSISNNAPNTDNVVSFPAPIDKKYNHSFYDYFIKQITSAEGDILITGDGFECADKEGENVAEKFIEAFRVALDKGVTVVRIETKSGGNIKWVTMLSDLVRDYGDLFSLYVVKEKNSAQMASVCVIDSGVQNQSVIEIMLSTKQFFGIKSAELAGTGVFIHRQSKLAQDLRKKVLSLTSDTYSIHPNTPSEVTNLLSEEFYFAFGSNMNSVQMKERCPSAEKVGVGVLPNHEIVFNRKGTYRPGGVASVQRKNGMRVYGVIWKMSASEFFELDKTEDRTAYTRYQENINTLDGKLLNCNIYKSISQGRHFEPDSDYLKIIIEAAIGQDLPKEYVQYLESFQSNA